MTRSLTNSTSPDYHFWYIDLSSVTKGKITVPTIKTVFGESPSRARRILKKGDVLMSMVRPNLQGYGRVSGDCADLIASTGFAVLSAKTVDRAFLYHSLFGDKIVAQLNRLLVGSNYPAINSSDVEDLVIALPEKIEEQRKIADILTTWDEALEKLDALIEAKDRRRKALMQQLLTGRKRLPGFQGKWKKVALGEVAENMSEQNKGRMGTTSLYGVTKADGVVPMRDHVKGESFDRCKRLETNWFAYNPMRINIGSIARWEGAQTVMVSGDYVVFRCHETKLLPNYLDHLRRSWMWQSFVTRGGNGSVRIRIYFSDLAEFTFPCPPIEEQEKIASILDTAQAELTLLRTQRTALDQQKRGLMQRLLTGKLRVRTTQTIP